MADSVLTAVVRAVAEAEGLDPLDLTPPLGFELDIEALEDYLDHTTGVCWATFEYHGWRITVSSDLDVDLEPSSDDE